MARIPEYPPILNGSTELQIAQIREFLMRLVRDLADAGIYDESTGAAEIEAVDQKIDDLADSLANVATSGSYNDLTDTPSIPPSITVDTSMSGTSANAVQNKVIKAYVDGQAGSSTNTANALNNLIRSVQNLTISTAIYFTHSSMVYPLTFSVYPNNSGYVSAPAIIGYTGADYTVTAYPASGYRFKYWTENGSIVSTSAAERWTANGSRDITANFEQI